MLLSPVYPPPLLKGDLALQAALAQALTTSDPQLLSRSGLALPSKGLSTMEGICRARRKRRQVI